MPVIFNGPILSRILRRHQVEVVEPEVEHAADVTPFECAVPEAPLPARRRGRPRKVSSDSAAGN